MSTAPTQSMSRLPLYLTQFMSGIMWTTIGPLLDSILTDLGIPLARGGLLSLGFFFGSGVGLIVFNVLLARIPAKWCLVGMAGLAAVGLGATGLLAQGLWSFLIPFFFTGFAAVLLAAIPGIWVSAHVKDGTARAMTIVMMASVAGMIVTPVALGFLLDAGVGWRTILGGEALISVVLLAVVVFLPLADIPRRENLRLGNLRKVVACDSRLLALIVVTAFLYLGGEMILAVWLPKFELDVFGASELWAGLAVTFYFVGQVIGRGIAVPLTRRFSTSRLLSGSMIVMAAFTVAISVAPNEAVSLGFVFGAGLGSSGAFSFIGSYAGRFPGWYAGVVFSAFQLSAEVGGMVFPYLTGPIADALGFRLAIGVAAVPVLMVAFIALRLREASCAGS